MNRLLPLALLSLLACRSEWKLDTNVPLPDCIYFADGDGDGFGDVAEPVQGWCFEAPHGAVADDTDCDDRDAAIHPSATESCNGIDDDCDLDVDEGLLGDWYADADADGYGDPNVSELGCEPGSGWVADGTDCDDAAPAVNPGADEACNQRDDDCDGDVDEGLDVPWYLDADGDGFGDAASSILGCEAPTGWVVDPTDCDDGNSAIHPDADERCNGVDDDCDGAIDDVDPDVSDRASWYLDADVDGYGLDVSEVQACEQPLGYAALGGDCDDGDARYNPGAAETDCNDPNDYNCDGSVSYADVDGDGYAACDECDDRDAAVNPGATELCDTVDNDCDGVVDEPDAADAATWFGDGDGDGYGDAGTTAVACTQPSGFSGGDTDCDDGDAAVNPGATELCDIMDNDCDGTVDEAAAADAATWYADGDGDGYGDAGVSTVSCAAPGGYLADATDCDDGDAGANPGAAELCDGVDNDCNGVVDEDSAIDATTWYIDSDGDGYGDAAVTTVSCTGPSGYVADSSDCDDGDAAVNPGAAELCDTVDNDCDGTVDEDSAVGAATWYADADGDGYGDAGATTTACDARSGYLASASPADCDDGDAAVHPGASERCNGVDDDCDGSVDEDSAVDAAIWYLDADADGYGDVGDAVVSCSAPSSYVADGTDCDDGQPSVHPGAPELCDGVDDDCDGALSAAEADADGDGYDLCSDGDCDDSDAAVGPDGDTDGDGSVDCWDDDDDDDGVYDDDELDGSYSGFVTDPLDADTDGDGTDDADDPAPLTDACAFTLYFYDDFTGDPSATWTDISGAWSWDGSDVFANTDTTAGANTWIGSQSWSDYVVEVVMRPDSGSNDPGVMTRAQSVSASNDHGRSYYVGLYPSNDSVVLGYQDGGWNVVASAGATINSGTWYTLQHRMSGSTHEVWLDGSLLISASDSTYSWGSVGFRTYQSPASYDYVLVCD